MDKVRKNSEKSVSAFKNAKNKIMKRYIHKCISLLVLLIVSHAGALIFLSEYLRKEIILLYFLPILIILFCSLFFADSIVIFFFDKKIGEKIIIEIEAELKNNGLNLSFEPIIINKENQELFDKIQKK